MTTAPSVPADREPLEATAARLGPVIGVALSFAALRERAGFEERERLAREMHDGIAQELVALGFRLDLVSRTLGAPNGADPQEAAQKAAEMLTESRTQLRRILGDLRSHISDLRVSVRPERGLGATMTSRLQSFGTSTEVIVSLRLDESGFRLPARVEDRPLPAFPRRPRRCQGRERHRRRRRPHRRRAGRHPADAPRRADDLRPRALRRPPGHRRRRHGDRRHPAGPRPRGHLPDPPDPHLPRPRQRKGPQPS